MLLELRQLKIKPGQQLLLADVSWQQFENILTDLGEHRSAKVSYSHGCLEIMVPLPEHEKAKEIIGDIIKILLDRLNIDYDSLGSTTLKSEKMTQGVEPDACFYIQNQARVLGENRLDLNVDSPPDLAVEINLTSRTPLDNYELLGVRELWRYGKQGLHIESLQDSKYVRLETSPTFPDLPIVDLVNQCVRESQIIGSSQALKAFKQWVRDNL
ncbi:Uma2 family endonuclease [Chamaesiphon sp. VAR_48_metabat_403]|uniref:Uma2 family endonuclease n=1 Tax=Chamaesiphon sp. VAR_48_metabat_403 TaxID=2964700 RepID=UPI00286D8F11|nr:Uma2 family endonuclease [Chamaesiphon sp. VAR_48_metabat_403]